MVRTAFLVDGFNLYHSLLEAQRALSGAGTRWLDLRAFCASFLPHLGPTHCLASVHYFSAIARHLEARKPDLTQRHERYIECLRATGVVVELGRFKEKWTRCPGCGAVIRRHEEKETDVAIGVRTMELLALGLCDAVILVTADSDLSPALRTAHRIYPDRAIYCALPFARSSFELRDIADACFKVRKERYASFQFPNPFVLPSGRRIEKPQHW
jgi:uncharacterized LabA/DUF88 family protein